MEKSGLQADAFRRKHRLTWDEVVSGRTIYVDREVIVETVVAVDRPVPMPLMQSIVALLSEPFPALFLTTIGVLASMAILTRLIG